MVACLVRLPDHIAAESMKCVQPLFDQYGAVWGIRSYSTVQKHSSLNDARCPDCRTFIKEDFLSDVAPIWEWH